MEAPIGFETMTFLAPTAARDRNGWTAGNRPLKAAKAFVCGLVLALTAVTALAARAADAPKLLTLQSAPRNTVKLEIRDVPGLHAAPNNAASAMWMLKPGDSLHAGRHPPDRTVELYTGTRLAPILLCRVVLRYYRSAAGWTPAVRIEQAPQFAFVGGHLQPLNSNAAIVRYGNNLPNADGFFTAIEFGSGSDSLAFVGWRVR